MEYEVKSEPNIYGKPNRIPMTVPLAMASSGIIEPHCAHLRVMEDRVGEIESAPGQGSRCG